MAKFRGEWVNQSDDDFLIKVSMSEMKMQDDAQQKQVILQLNSTGKCSDEYMLNAFGIDPAKMAETIQAEKIKQIERDTEIQLATIKAQAKLQKAQMQMGQPPEMYEDSPAGPTEQVPEQGTEQVSSEVPTEAEEAVQGEFDAIAVAKEIAKMSDMDAANAIGQIPPQHKEKVVLAANIIKNATKNKPSVDMRPLPEKLPPRRQS
jgi:hypothetical protein